MRLTLRNDGLATAFVAAAGALYLAWEVDAPAAGFGSIRAISAAILVLGVAGCAASGGAADTSGAWQAFVGWLGVLAFGFSVAAMVAGSAVLLRLAIADVVLVWIVATTRRLLTPRAVPPVIPAEPRELVGGRR